MDDFKNIGPKSWPLFERAGIVTLKQLKALGTEEAFLQIWEASPEQCHRHTMFLYAIEGAIEEINCLLLPEKRKKELKQFMGEFKRGLELKRK